MQSKYHPPKIQYLKMKCFTEHLKIYTLTCVFQHDYVSSLRHVIMLKCTSLYKLQIFSILFRSTVYFFGVT